MKLFKILFPAAVLITVLSPIGIFSCQNLNEQDLFGIQCDTSNLSYSDDIDPIMQSYCLQCHYNNSSVAPFSLQDYENVSLRVKSGQLEGAVNHLPGFSRMPKNGPKLPECQISIINSWIRDGAKNN